MLQGCVCGKGWGGQARVPLLPQHSWIHLNVKRRFLLVAWKAEFLKGWLPSPFPSFPAHTDFYGCESARPLVSQADFTAPHLLCELAGEQTMGVGTYLHKCAAPWQRV